MCDSERFTFFEKRNLVMTNSELTEGIKEESRGLVSIFFDAVRGVKHDYTSGPIGRAVLLLAIPMVLETLMESIFAVVDVFFVSRLGAGAVATVGLTESVMMLIYTVAMGLGIGVAAIVARRIGERDADGAGDGAAQAVFLGLVIATVIGIVGGVFAPDILRLMGGDAEVLAGVAYTRILMGGNATVLLLFLINAAFRGAGDATIAMRVLWLANGINLVLDPVLIFGLGPFPRMELAGAATATTIGRGTAVLLQLYLLVKGSGNLRVKREHVRPNWSLMWRMVKLSATGTFQIFIGSASFIGLVRILSTFGSIALAGYTIGIRVIIFAILPSWGMSNAASTMVGQALGANDPDRAEKAAWIAARYNMVFLGVLGILFQLFAPLIVSAFTTEPATMAYAVACLRIVSAGFLFYAFGMVLTQAFNGAGDPWTPTFINLFCFWLFELPVAYLLAHTFGFGPNGVFAAMALSSSTLAVVSAVIFRRGRWKLKTV